MTSTLQTLRDERDKVEPELVATKRVAAKLRIELEEAQKQQKQASDSFDEARVQVQKVAAECGALAKAMVAYQEEYRSTISRRAIGADLGTLTVGAKTYVSAKVKSLDAWELGIEHTAGVARLLLRDLPDELKTRFGYDPNAGEKPPPPVVISQIEAPAPAETPEEEGGSAPAPAPRTSTGSYAPPPPSKGSSSKSCGNSSVEVLARWKAYGAGMGGGGTTGTKVKGATSPLPDGYKPIGSSYSGTAMDRNKKK
ncbi:MAG: hypothetical protein JNM99_02700 [Verrucomicrobiaceae bacterium]|nr:hypothetical protein [Verrucomicrobiaceae bacterium]